MSSTTLLTLEQFEQFPKEDGIRYELDNGELVAMGHNTAGHELVKSNILSVLIAWLLNHPIGKILPESAFAIGPALVRIPDVSFVRAEKLAAADPGKMFRFSPDLVVEIASITDSATALRHKIDQYLSAGVEVVWLVYPDDQLVTVYQPSGIHEVRSGQSIDAPALLPGFSVPVRTFFE
jgi:Uma2 family endonuclease